MAMQIECQGQVNLEVAKGRLKKDMENSYKCQGYLMEVLSKAIKIKKKKTIC